MFRTLDAVKLSKACHTNVRYWCSSGLFDIPVSSPAVGAPGRTRWWSWSNLVALRTVVRLREAGVSLQAVRKVAKRIARESKDRRHPLSVKRIVTDGHDVFAVVTDQQLVSLLKKPGQGVWRFVALGDVENELRQRVRELDSKTGKRQRRRGRRAA